jgi:hypothetical protein
MVHVGVRILRPLYGQRAKECMVSGHWSLDSGARCSIPEEMKGKEIRTFNSGERTEGQNHPLVPARAAERAERLSYHRRFMCGECTQEVAAW